MSGSKKGRRRTTGVVMAGAAAGALTFGLSGLTAGVAEAATGDVTATFTSGVLVVRGDALDNVIVMSRNAAGTILVNGGSVPVVGTATVANTTVMIAVGGGGNDTIALDEANGALPSSILVGGDGNDVVTGGFGGDLIVGLAGNDTLLGKGGTDMLFGGEDKDTLTGGDADDQVFGDSGDDRMIWNPGDDTDLNEGGDGTDFVEVNGGNGAEQFAETANGTRVRFDRVTPAPFSIDIGTSEAVLLSMNGGDDSFTGSNGLATLIATTVDGGTGNDTIVGTDGNDFLIGSDGNDFVDGNRGTDLGALGAGDDTFQWDPGDGSDTIEGQEGVDTMLFNGANIAEDFDLTANGDRARFFRNVGNITMDTHEVESVQLVALGGADNFTIGDLTGSGITDVSTDLSAVGGVDDLEPDTVTVDATGANDTVVVSGGPSNLQVLGLSTSVTVTGASATNDRVTVRGRAGDDIIDASGVAPGAALLTLDGGANDDVLVGGAGNDTLLGGDGDDVLLGGGGIDVLDGGPGDNVVIQGATVSTLATATPSSGQARIEVHEVNGKSVVDHGGKEYTLPAADLVS
jgi:Ca2+-binding RTX toxin-like protein